MGRSRTVVCVAIAVSVLGALLLGASPAGAVVVARPPAYSYLPSLGQVVCNPAHVCFALNGRDNHAALVQITDLHTGVMNGGVQVDTPGVVATDAACPTVDTCLILGYRNTSTVRGVVIAVTDGVAGPEGVRSSV